MQQTPNPQLNNAKKRMFRQGALAIVTILLIFVLIFAMTAAWYTNVVQTNGLLFEAAVWGFEGEISLFDENVIIDAAPGDEGVIELAATSSSSETTQLSVSVSKADMIEEMQKRIFFYVDAPTARSGEVMERYYLNHLDSYTYSIYGGGTLNLTEEIHNDALLKWQWVYDVLGYYVRGVWDNENREMVITEYVRPIEYDYDEATTTFEKDENGNLNGSLLTVDGTTTPGAFLMDFSLSDGYEGQINPAEGRYYGGYYPVDIDNEGYGIWAYLCDYNEIKMNTIYDTMLGNGEIIPEEPYKAILMISSQMEPVEAFEVYTASGFTSALMAMMPEGIGTATIRLADDIALSSPLYIGAEQSVTVDLDGHNLEVLTGTYADKAGGIQVEEGGSLIVLDGALSGQGAGHVVTTNGGHVVFSGVTIHDAETACYVRDDQGESAADSWIRIVNCDISTTEECIYLSGNGKMTEQKTHLVVDHSQLNSSAYIGIMGNGSAAQVGTDIQIIDSEIFGLWAGIYQPQTDSILTITAGSDISGYTGLAVKGGTVLISDSTIRGLGTDPATPNLGQGSGFADTADGIYIEANYGDEIVMKISGSTIVSSAHGYGLQVFEKNAPNVSVTIESGQFENGDHGIMSDIERYVSPDSDYGMEDGIQYVYPPAMETMDDAIPSGASIDINDEAMIPNE